MTTYDPAAQGVAATSPERSGVVSARVRRLALPLIVLFALLVHVPALLTPRFFDDYDQLAMIEGKFPSHPGPFNLYDFINASNCPLLIKRGILPWWTQPRLQLRFLRPLPSALLWMDRRVFHGSGGAFDHAHSLLWWGAASYAVFALLEGLFSRRVAALGLLIFAIAPCHGLPLSWLANREELVSAAIGTYGLLVYSRWRERRRARDALLSFAVFAVAMLGGEYSLCFGGYVLAIELARAREPLAPRPLWVAPFAVPALTYLAIRHGLHYGAFGTGYYHDPIGEFSAYAGAVPRRLAILFETAWVGIDDRLWVKADAWKLVLLSAASLAVLAAPLWRVLRSLEGEARTRAWWLTVGSILALAPLMAVGTSVRLLQIPMVGVSAAVALVLDHAWFPARPQPRGGAAGWTGLVALALAFVHLVRAPVDTFVNHLALRRIGVTFERQMEWLHDHARGKSTVVVLRANLFQTLFAAPLVLDEGTPLRGLTLESGRSLLLRTGRNSIEIVGGIKPLFPSGPDDLVRNADVPLRAGETIELGGMRATVVALHENGTPHRLRFEFDRDIDDPSFLWVVEKKSGFEEQVMPALGFGEPLMM